MKRYIEPKIEVLLLRGVTALCTSGEGGGGSNDFGNGGGGSQGGGRAPKF